MRIIFILISLLLFFSCSKKPKAVMICGDHVCVNKEEAEQFFEENLSIEVKILKNKKKKEFDLVQLNLESTNNRRNINFEKKEETNEEIKLLSRKQIQKIKKDVKNKKKLKNLKINKSVNKNDKIKNKEKSLANDVCTKIEKCSIEEIAKYLMNQGKKKKFPDITIKQ